MCRGPAVPWSCRRLGRCFCEASAVSMSGPALFVSGPGALCIRARARPALLASGPGAPCVGARCSLSRVGVGARWSSPKTPAPGALWGPALCVGARRSVSRPGAFCVCVGAARSFFVSGPGALCRGPALFVTGARRSLCRGPALLCRAPALFASGPGTLSIGLRTSLSGCVWSPDCF